MFVTENKKGTSLQRNLAIGRKLRIRNVFIAQAPGYPFRAALYKLISELHKYVLLDTRVTRLGDFF